MQRVPKSNRKAQSAGTQPQMGMYCGAFRTSPKPTNPSWLAPVVAPVLAGTVAQPSEYRFASRAPVVRRSPNASTKRTATKNPRPHTAHYGQPPVPSTNGIRSTSSYTNQQYSREHGSDDQYDEFLASFQHRIDGMTGQRGGWGF